MAEALRRIGDLEDFELEPIVPALEEWRYRNKLEYSFGEADALVSLGFHARGRWDLIVDVEDCQLASEEGNAARNRVREWARGEGVLAWDGNARTGLLRNLVVREGRRTGQIQTRLVTTPDRLPKPPVDLHTTIEGDSGGTDGPTGAIGQERLRERLGELDIEMSHGAFFQTNTEMAEKLYGVAAEFAGLTGRERVFDLFCGIGTIGLTLAPRAGEVWGMEIVAEAIEDAERNAEANGIANARFMASNARTGVRPLPGTEVGCGSTVMIGGKLAASIRRHPDNLFGWVPACRTRSRSPGESAKNQRAGRRCGETMSRFAWSA